MNLFHFYFVIKFSWKLQLRDFFFLKKNRKRNESVCKHRFQSWNTVTFFVFQRILRQKYSHYLIWLYTDCMCQEEDTIKKYFGKFLWILILLTKHFTDCMLLSSILANWLNVCIRTKWLWVRIPLQSLKHFINVQN